MPPTHLSSKGKPKLGAKPSMPPRSRNTTPLPNARASAEPPASASTSYLSKSLNMHLAKKCDLTVEDILDRASSGPGIPNAAALVSMREAIVDRVLKSVEMRCTTSEGGLRELHGLRKNRAPRPRDKDKDKDRDRDRDRDRDKDADNRERKHKLKRLTKRHDDDDGDGDGKHPPTTGAHGVARQDGGDARKGES